MSNEPPDETEPEPAKAPKPEMAFYAETLADGTRRTVFGKVAVLDKDPALRRITRQEAEQIAAVLRAKKTSRSQPDQAPD
jgi:hypothetical protein